MHLVVFEPRVLLALLLLAATLASQLTSNGLTPVLLLHSSPAPAPIKWLVVSSIIAPIALIIVGSKGLGVSLALLVSSATLLSLFLNFVASMALGELSFWYFYVAQAGILITSWLAWRQIPSADRQMKPAWIVTAFWATVVLAIRCVRLAGERSGSWV